MTCFDCDVDPCVCEQSDSNDDNASEKSRHSSENDSNDDDEGCGCADGDCHCDDENPDNCERGWQGFQGPPGQVAADTMGTNSMDYSHFYGLSQAEDKSVAIQPGEAVSFPFGESLGNNVQRITPSLFLFKKPGVYRVAYYVSTVQTGQLQLELGQNFNPKLSRNDITYVPLISSTATNQNSVSGGLALHAETCVRIPAANSVLRLVNPSSNKNKIEIAKPDALTLRQPRVHWIVFQA